MAGIKRTSRLSVRKSHPDLRQGTVLEGNPGYIPQKKRKCVNDEGECEWGPRYRSSEEDERVLYHRSWCGGVQDRVLFPGYGRPEGYESSKARVLRAPGKPGIASSAGHSAKYLVPAGSGMEEGNLGQFLQAKPPQKKPIPVSSSTCPVVEEALPTFSPKAGAAVRLPGAYLNNPKPGIRCHPRRSVYEIYFGDDFGPDFEAAQVATRLSADAHSK